jgi:acetyl esterase/lipase
MSKNDRLDAELQAPLEGLLEATGGGFNLRDIPGTRAMLDAMVAAVKRDAPAIEGIAVEDRTVRGPAGAADVAIRIYRPTGRSEALPALLWLHGGGYVLGGLDLDDLMARQLAKDVQCAVVAVDYRLAPENAFPAALDDCYAALEWVSAHGEDLRIDASRIAIAGASAGGGLAACLALMARDRGEVDVAFQLLIYPALDDTNVAPASDSVPDTLLWTRENHQLAWSAYLGDKLGAADVSAYAAVSRAADLRGLPPAYIPVGELDLVLDENIDYARRLMSAGVSTELHIYPGAYHAFDVFAPLAAVSQRFVADRNAAAVRALHG